MHLSRKVSEILMLQCFTNKAEVREKSNTKMFRLIYTGSNIYKKQNVQYKIILIRADSRYIQNIQTSIL